MGDLAEARGALQRMYAFTTTDERDVTEVVRLTKAANVAKQAADRRWLDREATEIRSDELAAIGALVKAQDRRQAIAEKYAAVLGRLQRPAGGFELRPQRLWDFPEPPATIQTLQALAGIQNCVHEASGS